ncbi:MAG: FAD-binding oxidoreductase [Rhodospirillales bacterium 20-60-12]|nr:MAG: FAD-binding oxidoreductase [Rhodospirillales bacterium 20-60-12]HQT67886.1 FAD-binding protein [Acetobacteraceae bacterium]
MITTPTSEAEIAEALRTATAEKLPVLVQGHGSKLGMLRPVQAARTISTSALTGITLYAPKELIISARAGTTLSEIEAALAAEGQHIIAEPPDLSGLFGPSEQTIGGIVATNLSGPRRIAWGSMRDHVIGLRAVNGQGEILRAGGRVLKNVTGLDLCKLLTGSHGTLAIITEVTLKILPAPQATGTILLRGLSPARAIAAMAQALGSPFSVSGAARLADGKTAIRIEDFAPSVTYRCEKLADDLADFGTSEIIGTAESLALWRKIRNVEPLAAEPEEAIWRVSVAPSAGPAVLAAAERAGAHGFLDWGGGLVWLAGPASGQTHEAISTVTRQAGGVWWLMRAPDPLRVAVDVIPPEPGALSTIRRRVQDSFDPARILNPGRLYAA